MPIVTDIDFLRRPCEPVKNLSEGLDIARKLQAELARHNKHQVKLYKKSLGKAGTSRGLGLAAPQIGIQKQVCVVATGIVPIVLINPRIVERSETTIPFEEGCLSLPGVTVSVPRHIWVTVESLNLPHPETFGPRDPGDWNTKSFLRSVVVQHELDHLAGVLITDHQDTLPSEAA